MRRLCPSPRCVVRVVVVIVVVRLFFVTYDWLVDVEPAAEDDVSSLSLSAVKVSHQRATVDTEDSLSVQPLLDELGDHWQYSWIKQRIQLMWSEISLAARQVTNASCARRMQPRLKIMFLPGVLTLTDFARPQNIRRGGPLGELVQWSDLIAASYAVCHNLAFRLRVDSTSAELLSEIDEKQAKAPTGCDDKDFVDIIFTDLAAVYKLSPTVRQAYKYRFRVLDAFGTEAVYNDDEYVKSHPQLENNAGLGRLGLHLKQFYTLYPHTPDNSFLGFVVPKTKLLTVAKKEDYALIIGKEPRYLSGKVSMLKTVREYMELRATMRKVNIPGLSSSDVTFDGVVSSERYQSIIANAKVCIGLGDPVESPSAIEALACGCIFLNPRRKGKDSQFQGKPTSRQITSQVPYFEDFIGPPHAYTVDYDNVDALRVVLRNITHSTRVVQPFIPDEFTAVGFVERLHSYLSHQRLCDTHDDQSDTWPSTSGLVVRLSATSQSCVNTCHVAGLVCEPEYFRLMNNVSFIQRTVGKKCHVVKHVAEPFAPVLVASAAHLDDAECWLQSRRELFSCAESVNGVRICPCRRYKQHQIALMP